MNWLYKFFFWLNEALQPKKEPKPVASATPWYDLARAEIGVKEVKGSKHNKRILEYHQATSLKATDDETAWCSSFVCWCLEASGFKSTRSASARSHLKGPYKTVDIKDAKPGDIVIFSRPPSTWAGHVAFFVRDTGSSIEVLGGNQSNEVNITPYPKSRLLGVRRPV